MTSSNDSTKKIRILVVSQYFYPEQFRINDMCEEWVKRGYEVTVLTGIPNYPKGKLFPGYGLFSKRHDKYHGVEIIRLPIIPRGSGKVQLALNYVSFIVSGCFWKMFTKHQANLVFCFGTSPLTQALPAVWFAKKRRLPCFLYVQDLWPESLEEATGIKSQCVISVVTKMALFIYNNCRTVFVTSKSFHKAISDRGISEDKIVFWPQYAEDFYVPSQTVSPLIPPDNRFTIAFTGNIGTSQGLEILPKTASLLRRSNMNIRFILVGDGRGMSNLKKAISNEDVDDSFLFIPQQSPQDIPAILAGADAAFISFADKPLFSMTLPAKLQSYMACGMPIIAAAGGETRQVVNEARCGLCCDTGDAKGLANIIIGFSKMTDGMIRTLRDNALSFSKTHYCKQNLLDRIDVDFRSMS